MFKAAVFLLVLFLCCQVSVSEDMLQLIASTPPGASGIKTLTFDTNITLSVVPVDLTELSSSSFLLQSNSSSLYLESPSLDFQSYGFGRAAFKLNPNDSLSLQSFTLLLSSPVVTSSLMAISPSIYIASTISSSVGSLSLSDITILESNCSLIYQLQAYSCDLPPNYQYEVGIGYIYLNAYVQGNVSLRAVNITCGALRQNKALSAGMGLPIPPPCASCTVYSYMELLEAVGTLQEITSGNVTIQLGANITLPLGVSLPLLLANESWASWWATGHRPESNTTQPPAVPSVPSSGLTGVAPLGGSGLRSVTPDSLLMPIYRHLTFSSAPSKQFMGGVTELSLGLQPDVWEVNATGSLTFIDLVVSNLPEGPRSFWPRSMMLYGLFSVKLDLDAPLTTFYNCTIVFTTDFYLYWAYWIAQAASLVPQDRATAAWLVTYLKVSNKLRSASANSLFLTYHSCPVNVMYDCILTDLPVVYPMEKESVGILELNPQNPYAPLNIYEPICNALEFAEALLNSTATHLVLMSDISVLDPQIMESGVVLSSLFINRTITVLALPGEQRVFDLDLTQNSLTIGPGMQLYLVRLFFVGLPPRMTQAASIDASNGAVQVLSNITAAFWALSFGRPVSSVYLTNVSLLVPVSEILVMSEAIISEPNSPSNPVATLKSMVESNALISQANAVPVTPSALAMLQYWLVESSLVAQVSNLTLYFSQLNLLGITGANVTVTAIPPTLLDTSMRDVVAPAMTIGLLADASGVVTTLTPPYSSGPFPSQPVYSTYTSPSTSSSTSAGVIAACVLGGLLAILLAAVVAIRLKPSLSDTLVDMREKFLMMSKKRRRTANLVDVTSRDGGGAGHDDVQQQDHLSRFTTLSRLSMPSLCTSLSVAAGSSAIMLRPALGGDFSAPEAASSFVYQIPVVSKGDNSEQPDLKLSKAWTKFNAPSVVPLAASSHHYHGDDVHDGTEAGILFHGSAGMPQGQDPHEPLIMLTYSGNSKASSMVTQVLPQNPVSSSPPVDRSNSSIHPCSVDEAEAASHSRGLTPSGPIRASGVAASFWSGGLIVREGSCSSCSRTSAEYYVSPPCSDQPMPSLTGPPGGDPLPVSNLLWSRQPVSASSLGPQPQLSEGHATFQTPIYSISDAAYVSLEVMSVPAQQSDKLCQPDKCSESVGVLLRQDLDFQQPQHYYQEQLLEHRLKGEGGVRSAPCSSLSSLTPSGVRSAPCSSLSSLTPSGNVDADTTHSQQLRVLQSMALKLFPGMLHSAPHAVNNGLDCWRPAGATGQRPASLQRLDMVAGESAVSPRVPPSAAHAPIPLWNESSACSAQQQYCALMSPQSHMTNACSSHQALPPPALQTNPSPPPPATRQLDLTSSPPPATQLGLTSSPPPATQLDLTSSPPPATQLGLTSNLSAVTAAATQALLARRNRPPAAAATAADPDAPAMTVQSQLPVPVAVQLQLSVPLRPNALWEHLQSSGSAGGTAAMTSGQHARSSMEALSRSNCLTHLPTVLHCVWPRSAPPVFPTLSSSQSNPKVPFIPHPGPFSAGPVLNQRSALQSYGTWGHGRVSPQEPMLAEYDGYGLSQYKDDEQWEEGHGRGVEGLSSRQDSANGLQHAAVLPLGPAINPGFSHVSSGMYTAATSSNNPAFEISRKELEARGVLTNTLGVNNEFWGHTNPPGYPDSLASVLNMTMSNVPTDLMSHLAGSSGRFQEGAGNVVASTRVSNILLQPVPALPPPFYSVPANNLRVNQTASGLGGGSRLLFPAYRNRVQDVHHGLVPPVSFIDHSSYPVSPASGAEGITYTHALRQPALQPAITDVAAPSVPLAPAEVAEVPGSTTAPFASDYIRGHHPTAGHHRLASSSPSSPYLPIMNDLQLSQTPLASQMHRLVDAPPLQVPPNTAASLVPNMPGLFQFQVLASQQIAPSFQVLPGSAPPSPSAAPPSDMTGFLLPVPECSSHQHYGAAARDTLQHGVQLIQPHRNASPELVRSFPSSPLPYQLSPGGLIATRPAEVRADEELEAMLRNQQYSSGGIMQQVELLEVVGQGSFGVVYKGKWRALTVAIKTLLFHDAAATQRARQRALTEAAVNQMLSHDNIVNTYAHDLRALTDESLPQETEAKMNAAGASWKLYIIQEYCDGGNLSEAMQRGDLFDAEKGRPRWSWLLQLGADICRGLSYIHSQSVIHGDLSSSNIMLKVDPLLPSCHKAKVGDFGLSRFLRSGASHISNAHQGTPRYTAPEVLSQGRMTKAADIFSLGILLQEMYCGPRQRCSDQAAVHHDGCCRTDGQGVITMPQDCPAPFRVLVVACTHPDLQMRPQAWEALQVLEHLRVSLKKLSSVKRVMGISGSTCQPSQVIAGAAGGTAGEVDGLNAMMGESSSDDFIGVVVDHNDNDRGFMSLYHQQVDCVEQQGGWLGRSHPAYYWQRASISNDVANGSVGRLHDVHDDNRDVGRGGMTGALLDAKAGGEAAGTDDLSRGKRYHHVVEGVVSTPLPEGAAVDDHHHDWGSIYPKDTINDDSDCTARSALPEVQQPSGGGSLLNNIHHVSSSHHAMRGFLPAAPASSTLIPTIGGAESRTDDDKKSTAAAALRKWATQAVQAGTFRAPAHTE
ncbi:hypothetical protein CEUSTIGMA_g1864.t1 [Chlamydomonas eustigma]|uniref:Protein kinase domain-containing protein n=1 Tax=Chlamydomonas eustigma TaxID=1157962 RepID=A0A250WUI0_9CHLO|nr:hypothetical protein CEUSTIGMA_g1864.t1 [Chlamydomonas eustigma]|eukprot:GAX74416.1 hypothetical protein CEUSTIGMA_g1864.t1 [Chlamydomonas eustigma]